MKYRFKAGDLVTFKNTSPQAFRNYPDNYIFEVVVSKETRCSIKFRRSGTVLRTNYPHGALRLITAAEEVLYLK